MKMTRKRKISNFFAVLAVILCFICVGVWLPLVFGFESYYVESGSMAPEIPQGSMAYIKPIEIEEINAGFDVLLFSNDAGTKAFMHRAVKVDYETEDIYTKGDANQVADILPTSFSKCRGKVIFSVPYWGYVAKAVNSVFGKAVIALLVIIWLVTELEIYKSQKKVVKK